ncbi:MAG: DUF5752 family protein [Candidatus Alcyoniella australis]|nr:DUF5752 family protein [Candidatus Alcyoniella australis]
MAINSKTNKTKAIPFAVKDCALLAIATGKRAQNLRELREHLLTIHPESIYYHFWGGLLRPRFDEREYQNDFALWARRGLRDLTLAERLAIIDPSDFPDLESLRQELIEVIEERLDQVEHVPWCKRDQQFHFIRSQVVVFDTGIRLQRPEQLRGAIGKLSEGSVFYHLIDARRRNADKSDDFRNWLNGLDDKHHALCDCIAAIDPLFGTLTELRELLVDCVDRHLEGDAQ